MRDISKFGGDYKKDMVINSLLIDLFLFACIILSSDSFPVQIIFFTIMVLITIGNLIKIRKRNDELKILIMAKQYIWGEEFCNWLVENSINPFANSNRTIIKIGERTSVKNY